MQDQIHWAGATGPDFTARPAHRDWLMDQARRLFALFQHNAVDPSGGFHPLATDGRPLPTPNRGLHETTRMVHCFSLAQRLGLPAADRMIDHGMSYLWNTHRDAGQGGYFWTVADGAPVDSTKQAYGHAFVLLAAASAKSVGHPDADRLLDDVTDILLTRFWDDTAGAAREEFTAEWQPLGPYRGQNSNMHLTEALMAAHAATGRRDYLVMSERIAGLIINRHARALEWRVGEHFTESWELDRAYAGNPMFRPAGHTPGHALEWSRLLAELWDHGGRAQGWMIEAARALFLETCRIGWASDTGGFYYTMDWDNRPDRADRFWWPCCEGIAAASVLRKAGGDQRFEDWYRRIWSFAATHLIDPANGGWFPELGPDLLPLENVFSGKPDIYHSVQACLIPLVPATGGVTRGLG